jgi:hypothetical protein
MSGSIRARPLFTSQEQRLRKMLELKRSRMDAREHKVSFPRKGTARDMPGKKYECKRCGRPFRARDEEQPCDSKDVAPLPERPITIASCGVKGRFT